MEANDTLRGMATTAAAVLFGDETPVVAHVGDSRVYRWRDGALAAGDRGPLVGERAGARRRADRDRRAAPSVAQRRHARAGRRRRSRGRRRRDRRSRPAIACCSARTACRASCRTNGSRRSSAEASRSTRRARRSSTRPTTPAGPTTSPSRCCRSMWHNLARLARYRGLIQSLVARELKARYRGSVLGFFWSFVNPLLLLCIYTFVFATILPNADEKTQPYSRVHVLRPPAVDVVLGVAARGVRVAHRRRQPDQEGAVPRGGAAHRQRAGEHGALLPRAC